MTTLGLDFGERKIGVSLGKAGLASPLTVITYKEAREAIAEIARLCRLHRAERVVLGLPLNRQGEVGFIAERAKNFGSLLRGGLRAVEVVYFDETLSTAEALSEMRRLGLRKRRRQEKEDAFAAAILLQRYFDARKLSIR